MAEVFTWAHDKGPSRTKKMRVLKAQFGDGYAQRAPDGLNNQIQTWSLRFTGNDAKLDPIRDFLDDKGGATSFLWTNPRGEQLLWVAGEYSESDLGGGISTLSVTFEQSFVP